MESRFVIAQLLASCGEDSPQVRNLDKQVGRLR